MEVIRVLKMRIYPDDVQKARIDSTIDSCRFVYNHMLARNRKVHDRDQNAEQWCDWKVGNLRPLFEPILWFMKPYPQGSTLTDNVLKYGVGAFNETAFNTTGIMNDGVEMHSNMIKIKAEKSDRGLHPTQKPVKLMEFLISLTTSEGQTVLDPFCGCGTTVVAAINLKRNYIGFEINNEYYSNIIKRINPQ